jgi:hypothetical protein
MNEELFYGKNLNATTGDAAMWVDGPTGQRHSIYKVKKKVLKCEK